MKSHKYFFYLALIGTLLTLQSCMRSSSDVWEDTKTAGRHVQRGVRALVGDFGDSRQIHSKSDFECIEDENGFPVGNYQDSEYSEGGFEDSYAVKPNYGNISESDFIPLEDPTNQLAMADISFRPPSETPGEPGSSIPGIQAFRDPSTIPQLAGIFRPIYFEYNSSLVKGEQNLQIIHSIVEFLRYHPNVYIFVEGHTDERGPQAYNLALGSRRANGIRNLLIDTGINPDRIFTISYGKERPVILERHEEGWARNRRGEFKVYER